MGRMTWEQKKIAIAQTMDMLEIRHALPKEHPHYLGNRSFWEYLAKAAGINTWQGTVRIMCRYCNENAIHLSWQNDRGSMWWKR